MGEPSVRIGPLHRAASLSVAEVGNIGRSDRNQWFVRNVASEGFKLLLIAPAT
jgi:hypothetical protein